MPKRVQPLESREGRLNDFDIRATIICSLMGDKIDKKDIKKILKFDAMWIADMLSDGYPVKLTGVGRFNINKKKEIEEHYGILNPSTGEKGQVPFRDEYSLIFFKPESKIKKALIESTYGKALNRKAVRANSKKS